VPADRRGAQTTKSSAKAIIEVGNLPFTLGVRDGKEHTRGSMIRDKLQPLH